MNLFSRSAAALCVAVTALILLPAGLPLGVPEEWTWLRHALPAANGNGADTALQILERLLPAFVTGAVLLGLWFYGETWMERRRRGTLLSAGCYVCLAGVSWVWLQSVQTTAPLTHRNLKPLWVLYDPGASGYFFEAAHRIDDIDRFLQTYEDRMREGEVLHIGTHPPGLFLASWACMEACERSSTLRELVLQIGHQRHREAFRNLEAEAALAPPLTESQLAGLQLLSLMTSASAVTVLLPLAVLGYCLSGRISAWRICCLWVTVPGVAVFLPKSDVLFASTATSVLALYVVAHRSRPALRILLAMAAGTVCWVGLVLSLAHLPVLAALGLYVVLLWKFQRHKTASAAQTLAVLLATVTVLTVVWNQTTGCNLWTIWQLNLTNHEGFYSQFSRTWWKWLVVNPIELGATVGLPIAVVAVAGVQSAVQQRQRAAQESNRDHIVLCLALSVTWALLWLSGKNQGEAARLWTFLTPWVILCALHRFSHVSPAESRPAFRRLIACQLIIAVLTVGRVSGFSF